MFSTFQHFKNIKITYITNFKLIFIIKYVTKKIIILFQIILLSPFIVLIIFIYPIIKIKIFEIETRSIGHFSKPIEIFLSELKLNIHQKKTIYIWFPNKFISNKFLFKKWNEIILIFPRIIIEPIFFFFKKIPYGSFFLTPYRHWSKYNSWKNPWNAIDIYNVLEKTNPNLIFSATEKEKGNNYLKKYGISLDNNYICLAVRSPNYYFNKGIIKENKINLRDSDFKTFAKGTQYLSEKNYKIFNLGEKIGNEGTHNNIILYNNSNDKSDFLDIFLLFHCSFVLSTGFGLDFIPQLNRKKRFLINFSQIDSIWAIDYDVDLFTPKKFKSLTTGKLVPYSDVLKLNLSKYNYLSDLNRDGYDCVSNSEEEILSAVQEIEFFYNKKKYLSDEMDYLNKKFREIYYYYTGYKINRIKICDSFLRKNKDLIN
jgi:putative glycosyltransferase (TIGR04372 family)